MPSRKITIQSERNVRFPFNPTQCGRCDDGRAKTEPLIRTHANQSQMQAAIQVMPMRVILVRQQHRTRRTDRHGRAVALLGHDEGRNVPICDGYLNGHLPRSGGR